MIITKEFRINDRVSFTFSGLKIGQLFITPEQHNKGAWISMKVNKSLSILVGHSTTDKMTGDEECYLVDALAADC
ncbi:hypothetical protein 2AV2_155 [Nodularia phage vB_NpeS-2AV2]|jgi:hypothetical protein|uniref:Uncharacterized protein n=3 Tax=Ravarandavirus TaxID=2843444 RepID=A0A482MJN6_9CAUD|nr:hypothetical protein HWA92_gp155 [Nodularia phage vB_NpeS-2AV2]YP_009844978.1 hypothetical protein HWC13_gp142 [Nodularia phage vB_NspS-kac68v161]ALY07607.1 hypothetical protein 2AV2_155 [Nodularia phage vB_NpeS-2AV2]QBQ73819.1 hypothetical protein kac68v161_gp169 [Nodularia phage vB_NspS-kac68v161]QBQ74014.1 hypothetical protein kac68v162_gp166 [Nodularia phage vB_NspS-kac68v162]